MNMTPRKFLLIICAALVGRLYAVNITSNGSMNTGSLQYHANLNTSFAQEPVTTYSTPTTYDFAQLNLWRQIMRHKTSKVASISVYSPNMYGNQFGGKVFTPNSVRSSAGTPVIRSIGGGGSFASSGSGFASNIQTNYISMSDLNGLGVASTPSMRKLSGIGSLIDQLESDFWTWCSTNGKTGTVEDYQAWWTENSGTFPGDMPGGTYQDLLDRLGIPVGELPFAFILLLATCFVHRKNKKNN